MHVWRGPDASIRSGSSGCVLLFGRLLLQPQIHPGISLLPYPGRIQHCGFPGTCFVGIMRICMYSGDYAFGDAMALGLRRSLLQLGHQVVVDLCSKLILIRRFDIVQLGIAALLLGETEQISFSVRAAVQGK